MKIAVLGGRFDPPHLGHLKIAEEALRLNPQIDKFIFMPVFEHHWSESQASPEDRLRMLRSFLPQNMEVSEIEINRRRKSYTVDTIEEIRKQTDAEVYWVVGSDVLPRFHEWKDSDRLLGIATFLVFPRPGFSIPEQLPQGFNKLESGSLLNISSTQIRKLLKEGRSIKGLVPPQVEEYIIKHKLYG